MRVAARVAFIGWTLAVAAFLIVGSGSISIYHVLIMLAPGWLVAAALWGLSRLK